MSSAKHDLTAETVRQRPPKIINSLCMNKSRSAVTCVDAFFGTNAKRAEREYFKMKRNPLKAGILLCLLVALAEAVQAAIIANGGLETLPGDTFRTVLPGSTYAGWNSVGGGDIEFVTVQTAVPGGFWGPVAEGLG